MKYLKAGWLFFLIFMIVNLTPTYAVHSAKVLPAKEKTTFFRKIKGQSIHLFNRLKYANQNVAKALGFDLKDSVQKWLWYALIAWGIGVALYLGGFIWALVGGSLFWIFYSIGYLATLAGSVFFIVWLIKLINAA